ncbi:peptide chain release factor 2 [Caldilinea sp.]|uniref:peptide chain release factor 2 n=1 Tax=Caldilinea sp. TaxID=2293560 RepID=UPI002C6FBD0A|nr:peptide chain release factor 2 [Caldilinea sp.]
MSELETRLNQLVERVDAIRGIFDIPGKSVRIKELDARIQQSDFWDDAQSAQKVMQDLSSLREKVDVWEAIGRRTHDALDLYGIAEDDPDLLAELEGEASALEADLETREFTLAMSGPHDGAGAILSIHAGAGGTEAQDWTQMLLRMYLRWTEKQRYKTFITDETQGEEAGIKSVTVEINGANAYGLLRAEKGVHRLVRLSPFDSNNRRHTSFAKVEVMPVLDEDIDIQIDPKDIEIEVFLSSGAGGQNVQKNQTAVRIRHLPTGLIVTSQNERSQGQNREMAMRVLRGRLYEMEEEKRLTEKAKLKGKVDDANFGSQIRSYVLHPYQMVKDLRTDVETGNTAAVLDGEIDMFIEAWLKSNLQDVE